MFTKLHVTRVFQFLLPLALVLVALPLAAQSSSSLPVILDEITDEWENEILKLRVGGPGVLVTGLVTAGDQDLFTLVLESSQTVVVEADGEDLEGSLLDGSGTTLATAVSAPGVGFRIVRSLGSGQYRLSISGGEGSYRVLTTDNQ
jgi:hypothetical protein